MTRRLTRHDFINRGGRAAVGRFPYCRRTVAEVDAEGPPLAELLPPPPPPKPRPIVRLDLRNAPSSMETLAESWRAKGG